MIGPHDVGGRGGFGRVAPEVDEPVFHADWEARVLGMTLCAAAAGGWTLDRTRLAREDRDPADYYGSSYYEIWLKGLTELLAERGLVTNAELAAGRASAAAEPPTGRVLAADDVAAMLRRGGPTSRDATGPARFAVGDRVRAVPRANVAHTRLPSYTFGRTGTVESINGAHVFPDTNAAGAGEQPHWLYTVVFDGVDLWGADAEPGLTVSVDAWEPYLEPATDAGASPSNTKNHSEQQTQ